MSERIIIDFDDEKDKPKEDDDRIVVDLDEEAKKIEIDNLEEDYEQKVLRSRISSYFRGNPGISNYFESELKFPEGIERGFRKRFTLNINDEFLNSILENNKYIILSSRKGNIYLVDRFRGVVSHMFFFEHESFEKTGLVISNVAYLNSVRKIVCITSSNRESEHKEIYESDSGNFIWSNLNWYKDSILFLEYNKLAGNAHLKTMETSGSIRIPDYSFKVGSFVSELICVAHGFAFVLFDASILVYDLEKRSAEEHLLNVTTDENSFIFYLNNRIYITNVSNELYYLDLPPGGYKFKNTGIRNNYINSIGGFGDNIFAGTLNGWSFYKSSGLQIYNFEDENENRIECISKKILAVSQKNKIVFCNLNRFQEAEGYVISARERNEAVEIVSVVFSKNEIFVLTDNGILEVYASDKLNIHL